MTLKRRLLLYLLFCAPLAWGLASWISVHRARHEINELFDTQLVRLARQVQVMLEVMPADALPLPLQADAYESQVPGGEPDLRDLSVIAWDSRGHLLIADKDVALLEHRTGTSGFVDEQIDGEAWRVYYQPSPSGRGLVAVGQKAYERDELIFGLTAGQLMPWLLVLPALMAAMAWAVSRSLAPVDAISRELQGRDPDQLQPLVAPDAPAELRPLLASMNGMFHRIGAMMARERRFTADAAHELRTPLAVLRAQWDVLRRSSVGPERARSEAQLGEGLARMDRLVNQLLALARLESGVEPLQLREVVWRQVAEQVIGDTLYLAERRRVELVCDWPESGPAFPLHGDAELLAVLLRNLLDNAVRYGPEGGTVALVFEHDGLRVENDGPALPAHLLARMGERFYRPEGHTETGSGLGVSIVKRIAALHGLHLGLGPRSDGQGTSVRLSRLV